MKLFLEKNYKFIVGAILGFMAIVSVLNAKNDSAIFDETAHIGAAYSYVSQQEMRLNPEHPPLIKDLAGLPLLFLNLNFDTSQPFWTGDLPNKWDEGQWAAGRHLLYQAGNNPDQIIFWARLPIVLLSLILGLFIFKWVRESAGAVAGLLALALYAFDPNILGHNHFVTTDLGIAAFLTFAFYYYLKFLKHPSWKNVLLAGLFLGLLQLAKFSSITAFPVLGLATLIYPLVKLNREKKLSALIFKLKNLFEYIGKGALVFAVSIVVVWFAYSLNTFNMKPETISRIIDVNFSPTDTANAKNIYTNKTLHWLNDHALTRPLSEYGLGMGYVFRRVAGGNGAYFMGQVSGQAFPAYFPTVFAIKEPLPSLFLMLFALIYAISKILRTFFRSLDDFWKKTIANISHFLRTHLVQWTLFTFVALYAYISITGNLNIGFRHLFPILPFIYILAAKNIMEFLKPKSLTHSHPEYGASLAHNSPKVADEARQIIQGKNHKLAFSFGLLLLIIFLFIETAAAYPYYMSYFNQAAGGPKNGYRFATDSNADWGQDLKRLKIFIDKYNSCVITSNPSNFCSIYDWKVGPIEKIRVDYFGGGDIKTYIGDKYLMWWDSKRPIEPGWYAISTNFLMGSLYDKTKKDEDSYRWLKNIKPVAQVGTSILIYRITPSDIK